MTIPDFSYEEDYAAQELLVVGIDEAGRGPLAGPVVAVACVLKDPESIDHADKLWGFVRDSKTVSEKKREEVFDFIHTHFYVGIGIAAPEVIDRMNILQANFFAMKAALSDLDRTLRATDRAHSERIVLIDGNQLIPNTSVTQKCITKGDAKVKSIAAASIIAKVTRDRKMIEFDQMFPQYGFAAHKGYGTKQHMDALKEYGATPIHRKSFAPVKRVLDKKA